MFLSLRSIFSQVQDFILPCEVKPDSVGADVASMKWSQVARRAKRQEQTQTLSRAPRKQTQTLRVSPFVRCKSVTSPEWSINGQFAVTSCVVINNQHKQPLVENPSGLHPL